MSIFKEYSQYDATGLKELLDRGEVSVEEVIATAQARIKKVNPKINAVIHHMDDTIQEQLDEVSGDAPLRGIPFLMKDLGLAYKGVPLQMGSKAFKRYIPDYDSTLVSRYKKAGLITLGKTNTPEFGLKGTTEPEAFGPTLNPWNTAYSTGGSSGGSAAAVASGMVPVASGSDGGGSIRIPSSFNNLFGLKPGKGRMPTGPHKGESWQGAVSLHVISRSVRDSAYLLDLTHGIESGSRSHAPEYSGSYLQAIKEKPKTLRIAVCGDSPIRRGVHDDNIKALNKARKLLTDMGHMVIEDTPDIDGIALAKSYLTMYMGEVNAAVKDAQKLLKKKLNKSDFELTTWMLYHLGEATSAGEFVEAIAFWDEAAWQMSQFFQKYDLYLTPTTAYPPAKIGALDLKKSEEWLIHTLSATHLIGWFKSSGRAMDIAMENLTYTPFTQLANLTGLPAASVPMGIYDNNLPLGVQFIAPKGKEELLFKIARQIEIVEPWLCKELMD